MRLIEEIMNEICEVMDKFDEDTLDQAMTLLSKDKKIFVDGEGRSGFVGRCFAEINAYRLPAICYGRNDTPH